MVLTQIPPVEHFLIVWHAGLARKAVILTRSPFDRLGPSVSYYQKSIRLAEKRLFPLNYTPKRSQSLKKTDFVPVADFTPNPVERESVYSDFKRAVSLSTPSCT